MRPNPHRQQPVVHLSKVKNIRQNFVKISLHKISVRCKSVVNLRTGNTNCVVRRRAAIAATRDATAAVVTTVVATLQRKEEIALVHTQPLPLLQTTMRQHNTPISTPLAVLQQQMLLVHSPTE